MIKPDQIPDAVVKAALLADERIGMREVIAAALNTWPGADTGPNIYHRRDAILHLPLPQKEGDNV